jgi:hypothetical protein
MESTLLTHPHLVNQQNSILVLRLLQNQTHWLHNASMPFHLDDIALFTRIAELGTLSAAARERDVPVSQVTRSLARLEADCGARLLHRSTHGLSLTDEGDTLLAGACSTRQVNSGASSVASSAGPVAGCASA